MIPNFLDAHIKKYAVENEMTVFEVLHILKETMIPPKTWAFWSFSGYDSFESKMKFLKNAIHPKEKQ